MQPQTACPRMADLTMCSSTTCPLAATCRLHEASGTVPSARDQDRREYHWRRARTGDDVICHGFEPAPALEEAADG